MTTNDGFTSQLVAAQQLQSQFRFYVLSLIFTLLAASVQTAKLGHSAVEDVTEILAWTCLLIAGLVALWYVEWEPNIREKLAYKSNFEQMIQDAKKAKLSGVKTIHVLSTGKDQSIEEQITNLQSSKELLGSNAALALSRNNRRYTFVRYAFIAGLVLVIFSRASSAIASLFGYELL